MENQEQVQEQPTLQQVQLTNSTGILIMGIISIVCFCCLAAGLVGITLGILAIIFGNKAIKEYNDNPARYTIKSYKNANAGRICGIIGLSIGGLWIIGVLAYLSAFGWAIGSILSTMPWDMIGR